MRVRFPGQFLFDEWSAARRFNALPSNTRRIVFYAEDGDSWPHFEPIIRELTGPMGLEICYLTSSRSDPVLSAGHPRLRTFCIGQGTIRTSLFMSMRANVCVMTLPDLETFHLKRSRRQPVHYVYVFHSMVSTHMIYRKAAFDHFDTIMCVGPHHLGEIRSTEQAYGLKAKNLVRHGYGRLDTILDSQRTASVGARRLPEGPPRVLLAPSWGPGGLVETRGVELCRILVNAGFDVTVRPHPMTRRKWPESVAAIEREFEGESRLQIEARITGCGSLETADVMISDFSGAALEFAFGFERPVLFVDVPRKVNNPEYRRIGLEPLEVSAREKIGGIVSPDRLASVPERLRDLMFGADGGRRKIRELRGQTVYNLGASSSAAALAISRIAHGTPIEEECGSCCV